MVIWTSNIAISSTILCVCLSQKATECYIQLYLFQIDQNIAGLDFIFKLTNHSSGNETKFSVRSKINGLAVPIWENSSQRTLRYSLLIDIITTLISCLEHYVDSSSRLKHKPKMINGLQNTSSTSISTNFNNSFQIAHKLKHNKQNKMLNLFFFSSIHGYLVL